MAVRRQPMLGERAASGSTPAWVFGGAGLVAEVLGVYARVRWLVVRRGPIEAVPILRRGLQEHAVPDSDGLLVLRSLLFARSVTRVLACLPADSRCLMRSLVIASLLARRGVFTKVVIGVLPSPSFAAHAWIEIDGKPLLPGDDASYPRLVEV